MFWRYPWWRRPRGAPLLPVPGGRAQLGGASGRVFGFALDVRPVTNAEYADFLRESGHEKPPWMYRDGFCDPEQPIVGVTFAEAQAFARWAGKRLPSQAEWVRAVVGDRGGPFPWGSALPDAARAVFGRGERGTPARPGERPAGVGPFGHADLLGNTWEWCQDGACRGGFWGAKTLDPTTVLRPDLGKRSAGIGFRCAR